MIFFRTLRYADYLLFARHRNGHGIHSPFVFDLVGRVFRNKTSKKVVLTIESLRKKCLADQRKINVLDLGAGSGRMKKNSRKVSEITGNSAVPRKYGLLLQNLAAEFGKPAIVELGTSVGISTMYLASGCPDTVVYTIEGCPGTSGVAAENFSSGGFENINLLNGSFDEILPELSRRNIRPGFVFIDGNHRKEPVCRYFNIISAMSDENTVIVLDDIHHSREMEEAWDEIRNYGDVTLSIDIYRMGLVFFRKGLTRGKYTICY